MPPEIILNNPFGEEEMEELSRPFSEEWKTCPDCNGYGHDGLGPSLLIERTPSGTKFSRTEGACRTCKGRRVVKVDADAA